MEIIKEFQSAVRERIVNPLTGAIIVSWLLINNRLIIVIFSNQNPAEKFKYIDTILYGGQHDKLLYMIAYPLIASIMYLTAYQYLAQLAYWLDGHFKKNVKKIKAHHEDDTPITIEEKRAIFNENMRLQAENEKLKTEHSASLTASNTAMQGRDKTIIELGEEINTQREKISRMNEEINQKNHQIEKLKLGTSITETYIRDELITNEWKFLFGKSAKREYKTMKFGNNGEILSGMNDNESWWRIHNGKLEFMSRNDVIQNRFIYVEELGMFISTDEDDLISPKNGYYGQKLIHN